MLICNLHLVVLLLYFKTRIGGVMSNVLALSAVDRGFEPRSDLTKDYTIGIYCFSAKLGIRIMCQSGAIYLSMDCCLSKLAQ